MGTGDPNAAHAIAGASRAAGTRSAALADIDLQLASERDPRRLLDDICHAARELMGAKHALLALNRTGGEYADFWATSGMDNATAARIGAPMLRSGTVGEVLQAGEARRVANPGGDPVAVGYPATHPPVHSLLVAPIASASRVYGWIGVSDKVGAEQFGADQFDADDMRLLSTLCGLLGRTYENNGLLVERQASEDRYRTIFENSALGVFAVNAEQHIVDANPALLRMLGYPSDAASAADTSLVAERMYVDPQDRRRFRALLDEHGAVADFETRWWRKDGSIVWISLSAQTVAHPNGSGIRHIGMAEEVTDRVQLRNLVSEREAGLRHAERLAKLAHVVTGADGEFESWSDTLPELAGLTIEQLPRSTRAWLAIVHPDDRDTFRSTAIDAGLRQRPSRIEYRLLHASGAFVHIRQTMEPLGGVSIHGQTRWFNTLQDISEQQQAAERIKRLNRVYAVLSAINSTIVRTHDRQQLFDEACRIAVIDGAFKMAWIGVIDPDTQQGRVVAWHGGDQEYVDKVRFGAGAQMGQSLASRAIRDQTAIVCNDIVAAPELAPLHDALLARGHRSLAVFPLIVDGRAVAVLSLHAQETGFFDEQEMGLLNELAGDVAFALEYIAKEQKLDYLAYYDALTGLPNSTLFRDRLVQFLGRAAHDRGAVVLYLIDLDHFTHVNDTLGRHAGDLLLTHVAERFSKALPKASSLARISADTFAVAVAELGDADNASVTLLENCIFGALQQGFMIDGQELRVTARAGIAMFPEDGADADTLFKNAEAALKQIKGSAERYLFYAPEMNTRMAEKVAVEGQLLEALQAGQFVLHYQPKVDLSTGQIVGSEALLRWQHPQRGLLPPGEFLAIAEDSDAIFAIGEWVLREACAQTAKWHEAGLPAISVSVNLSARQFWDEALHQRVARVLDETGLPPQSLELELTEQIVMQDVASFVERLRALKLIGVKLSLDDFGTGYSSLSYLKRFPLDRLKVDQSFIHDVTTSPDDAAIVRAVISLGHSLGLDIVAEGVETEAQVEWLRRERCEQIQGYFFSRALPVVEFEQLLRSRKGLPSRSASESLEAKTLLVVDDEPGILASLVRLLRRDGYRILTAQSAKDALDLLALNVVHVIVSDHRMPVMTGAEFFGKVKTLYPDTVRILFSGYIEIEALTDAVNRGAVYRFLLKPWDDDALRENIREAFHHYWLTHKGADSLQATGDSLQAIGDSLQAIGDSLQAIGDGL